MTTRESASRAGRLTKRSQRSTNFPRGGEPACKRASAHLRPGRTIRGPTHTLGVSSPSSGRNTRRALTRVRGACHPGCGDGRSLYGDQSFWRDINSTFRTTRVCSALAMTGMTFTQCPMSLSSANTGISRKFRQIVLSVLSSGPAPSLRVIVVTPVSAASSIKFACIPPENSIVPGRREGRAAPVAQARPAG